jgi:segregation and condensation protein B
MENNKSIIESLLYVAGADGIDVADIKRVIGLPSDEIRKLIKEIAKQYELNYESGLTIKIYGDHYYLFTKPENKDAIAKLNDVRLKNPLTPALMETLAIIAYNSPCTRSKVDDVRGSNSEGPINRLIHLELVNEVGRADTPGRPYIYEVTQKFFNLFGVKSIKDLPKFEGNAEDFDIDTADFFNTNREEKQ